MALTRMTSQYKPKRSVKNRLICRFRKTLRALTLNNATDSSKSATKTIATLTAEPERRATPFPVLGLPLEIRTTIWRYALESHWKDYSDSENLWHSWQPGLLLINRQINAEVLYTIAQIKVLRLRIFSNKIRFSAFYGLSLIHI